MDAFFVAMGPSIVILFIGFLCISGAFGLWDNPCLNIFYKFIGCVIFSVLGIIIFIIGFLFSILNFLAYIGSLIG